MDPDGQTDTLGSGTGIQPLPLRRCLPVVGAPRLWTSAPDSLSVPATRVSGLQRGYTHGAPGLDQTSRGGGREAAGDPSLGLTAPPRLCPGHLRGSAGLGRVCHLVLRWQRQPHRLPGFDQLGLPGDLRAAQGEPEASADSGGVSSRTRGWGPLPAARLPTLVCLRRASRCPLSFRSPASPRGCS